MPIDKDIIRIAAIQYANFSLTKFTLEIISNNKNITKNFKKKSFNTQTSYALRKAETEFFKMNQNLRLVLIMTKNLLIINFF